MDDNDLARRRLKVRGWGLTSLGYDVVEGSELTGVDNDGPIFTSFAHSRPVVQEGLLPPIEEREVRLATGRRDVGRVDVGEEARLAGDLRLAFEDADVPGTEAGIVDRVDL